MNDPTMDEWELQNMISPFEWYEGSERYRKGRVHLLNLLRELNMTVARKIIDIFEQDEKQDEAGLEVVSGGRKKNRRG